jgi:hypothetical protein
LLQALLAHPLTKGLGIDDPRTAQLRLQIIQEKVYLRQVYQEWYRMIAAALPSSKGAVLELGAGAGFLREFVPNLITSELFLLPSRSSGVRCTAFAVCIQVVARHRK